jgi:predicted GIY-YIG superfamily endonuclease
MGKIRKNTLSVISIGYGIINDELDIIDGKLYYMGERLSIRFKEILGMNNSRYDFCDINNKKGLILDNEEKNDVLLDNDIDIIINNNINILFEEEKEYVIYEISSNKSDKVYIGSTKNLEKRISMHIRNAYIYENYKLRYCSSYELLKTYDITVRILKKKLYLNKKLVLLDESKAIKDSKIEYVNEIDPLGMYYLTDNGKNNRKNRKIARINCLYNSGWERIKDSKLCDDDMIKLKYDLIEECKKEIKLNYNNIEVIKKYNIIYNI